jgi:hypothetical protein
MVGDLERPIGPENRRVKLGILDYSDKKSNCFMLYWRLEYPVNENH